jgi:NADPH2:quinone reductase
VDVIFDPVGGDFSEAALRAIAWKGRHLVVGFAAGAIPRLPLNLTLLKGCDVRGVYFGDWTRLESAQYKTCIVDLARQAAAGRIRCHIDRVYPLAEMPQALKVLSERSAMGKVIVTP